MADVKIFKDKLADGLIKRTSSVLDEIVSKSMHEDGEEEKRSMILNEVKPGKNK